MSQQEQIGKLLALDTMILELQSQVLNNDGVCPTIQTLVKMAVKGQNLVFDLEQQSLELFSLKDCFTNVNNVFNDKLPDKEYFTLKSVIEKYSLLYPERCTEIMKEWVDCLLSIKTKFQAVLQKKQEILQRTKEILSFLNIQELCQNYEMETSGARGLQNLSLELEIDCTNGITTELAPCFQFLKTYFTFIPIPVPATIPYGWMDQEGLKSKDLKITNTLGSWRSCCVMAEIPANAKSATYLFQIHRESNYTHIGVIHEDKSLLGWLGGLSGWGFSSCSTKNISQLLGNDTYQNPIDCKYTNGDTVSFTEDFESKRLILSVEGKENSTSIIHYPELTREMKTIVSLGTKNSCVELLDVRITT